MVDVTAAKFFRLWFCVCSYQAVKAVAQSKSIFSFSGAHPESTIFYTELILVFRLLINWKFNISR